jgi:hypothetical protein
MVEMRRDQTSHLRIMLRCIGGVTRPLSVYMTENLHLPESFASFWHSECFEKRVLEASGIVPTRINVFTGSLDRSFCALLCSCLGGVRSCQTHGCAFAPALVVTAAIVLARFIRRSFYGFSCTCVVLLINHILISLHVPHYHRAFLALRACTTCR